MPPGDGEFDAVGRATRSEKRTPRQHGFKLLEVANVRLRRHDATGVVFESAPCYSG